VFHRLGRAGWLSDERYRLGIDQLVTDALTAGDPPIMKGAQVMNLIEFGRSVHAEMAALLDASRRGVAVRGCTLYTTTFPCHDCARHIVAAGIKRVVYIEPYPKSLAAELYPDSIAIDEPPKSEKQIGFTPFIGIAPTKYLDLFDMVERKEADGTVVKWDKNRAFPRMSGSSLSYLPNESAQVEMLRTSIREKGLYQLSLPAASQ
jgi:cytidine deaminase